MLGIWFGFAAGLIIVIGALSSVVGTLVVPRAVNSRISRAVGRSLDGVFLVLVRSVRSYERRDRILAWQSPLTLLVRLTAWLALLVADFTLLLLPSVKGHLGQAVSEAGSSMFTLGYAAPIGAGGTAVHYLAAFTGLVVIGLQVGYLPALYAAFNRRETEVSLLGSRAGVPAWGPEILARTKWGIQDGDIRPVLETLFVSWERWAAEVAESHTTYLTLARFRSPQPMSHWLISLIAVMDAAAMHLALAPSSEPKLAARLALRTGFVALEQIARAMQQSVSDEPDPDAPISDTYDEFRGASAMLRELGYPIDRSDEESWSHFRGWRANYDAVALVLAQLLDAPPALWTGTRRWPSTQIPPRRPAAMLARAAGHKRI
ncbi:hypothetical protein GCM10009641_04050 [Mycobacterium cookii]|uniref:Uncharacterized protein n=1 Tax=Mycobacterium cookii TaxID=1775 RepID=A0A7I7L3I2_9MYCO|nr:hypothetical protein [Mycobacterium cookii]MCV7329611.1 hypothetical protein [Mycobacterium cookii]BBX48549.1 hypothetical protein MCOO_45640 [Mycobacterium cookii]